MKQNSSISFCFMYSFVVIIYRGVKPDNLKGGVSEGP